MIGGSMELHSSRQLSRRRRNWFAEGIRFLAIALCVLAVSFPVSSQSSTGRILGDVRDQSDAAIVGATVVITDVQRAVTRTLVTDGAGAFLASNLDPGTYTITVTNPGFKR